MNINIKKPNLFLIGAPKCGTTSVHYYLKQHPEIYMSEVKEPRYFGKDLLNNPYFKNLAEYLSIFQKAGKEKYIGEATTYYLYSKTAAKEIYKFAPKAKIIILIRNPVDFLYSLHSEYVYKLQEPIVNFEEALRAEKDRRKGKRLSQDNKLPSLLFYSDWCKFSEQISRFYKFFGKENVLVLILDDLKKNTKKEYKKMLKFLSVDENIEVNLEIKNPNKQYYSKFIQKLIGFPPIALHNFFKAVVPTNFRILIINTIYHLNSKHEPRPPMNKNLRNKLQKIYEPEVKKLSKLLNRDLRYWSRNLFI